MKIRSYTIHYCIQTADRRMVAVFENRRARRKSELGMSLRDATVIPKKRHPSDAIAEKFSSESEGSFLQNLSEVLRLTTNEFTRL